MNRSSCSIAFSLVHLCSKFTLVILKFKRRLLLEEDIKSLEKWHLLLLSDLNLAEQIFRAAQK